MPAPTLGRVVNRLRAVTAPPAANSVADRELLDRYLQCKDEAAFTSLVRRHERTVLSACRHVLSDPADIADAFQATFLVLLRNARRVTWHSSLGGWLFAVAHRVAVSARRKARLRAEKETRAASRAAPTAEPADLSWREACDVLHEELDRLRDTYRLPLLLCYLDGLSRDEAAKRLRLTTDAVRGRLDRGREKLRARLARRGVTLSAGLLGAMATNSAVRGVSCDLVGVTVEAARCGPVAHVAGLVKGTSSRVLAGKTALALAVVLVVLVPFGTGFGQRGGAGERQEPTKADPPAPVAKKEANPLRGRVLSPDGKPFAGAKLILIGPEVPKELGTTDDEGHFAVVVPAGSDGCYLVARCGDLGLDFVHIGGLAPNAEPALRLVADHPIRGRVIDTEGKPIAGAWVKVDQFGAFKDGSLDPLLAAWKKLDGFSGRPYGDRTIWTGIGALFATETNKDGRFEFRGVGAERFLVMRAGKAGFTEREACIANRKGLDAKGYNVSTASTWLLYGPEPTIVVEREKLIRGRVTDSATGKPRAGVHVILSRREGGDLLRLPIGAWTDKDGNYEIRGARKAGGYMVEVKSDSATGHMACQGSSDDTPGYDPIVINLQVKKGVIITGRMIDKSTGEPVVGFAMAGVLSDNSFAKEYPSFDSSAWFRLHDTDKDGRFRVVGIPGRVILMGGPNSWDEMKKFKRPVPDPRYPKYFRKDQPDFVSYYTLGGAITPVQGSFGRVLEIKADATEVEHDIELEPANALAVKIQDADGKPLAGALVTGLGILAGAKPRKCDDQTCEVYRLEPDKPRLVVFYHAERKLARVTTLKGNEKDPEIRLGPVGSARGRLFAGDGKPAAGGVIEVRYAEANAREMHAVIHKETRVVANKDGDFSIDGLIPGADFQLWCKQDKSERRLTGESRRVKAGEPLDFGNLKLPPARDGD